MAHEPAVDKRLVRRAFEKAAAGYDAAAVLQHEVCQRMLARLDYVKLAPAAVLDAGCGTGNVTAALRVRYPRAVLYELDIALGMVRQACARVSWLDRVRGRGVVPVCGDIEKLPLRAGVANMVWSNLALQWVREPPRAFAELRRVLAPGGLLMFSTFGPDTLKELRAAYQGTDRYNHVNQFVDMHDVGDMLVHAGFADPVMDMEYITLTYNDVKAVMQDLRSIGAHNATAGRATGMMGKKAWGRVLENYERFRRDGKLPATFEVIYGHAWKAQPKKISDGRAIIKTPFKL